MTSSFPLDLPLSEFDAEIAGAIGRQLPCRTPWR
jgi:hypothetical protein